MSQLLLIISIFGLTHNFLFGPKKSSANLSSLLLLVKRFLLFIFSGNSTLEVVYLSGKFALLSTYMKHTNPPFNFNRYTLWMTNEVKSQPLLFLNQLVFGCLEAYFQFKLGVKSSDTDLLMAGLLEAEKIVQLGPRPKPKFWPKAEH